MKIENYLEKYSIVFFNKTLQWDSLSILFDYPEQAEKHLLSLLPENAVGGYIVGGAIPSDYPVPGFAKAFAFFTTKNSKKVLEVYSFRKRSGRTFNTNNIKNFLGEQVESIFENFWENEISNILFKTHKFISPYGKRYILEWRDTCWKMVLQNGCPLWVDNRNYGFSRLFPNYSSRNQPRISLGLTLSEKVELLEFGDPNNYCINFRSYFRDSWFSYNDRYNDQLIEELNYYDDQNPAFQVWYHTEQELSDLLWGEIVYVFDEIGLT